MINTWSKNIIWPLIIAALLVSCKKDICFKTTELTDRYHLADPKSIGSNLLSDTLALRPELQVYRINQDVYGWVAKCNVFYKEMKVFTSQYFFHGRNNSIISYDTVDFSSINFSLSPSLQYDEAMRIARREMDFSKTCVSYRLGIYDLNAARPIFRKNYKLVWKIQGDTGYPYVFLDANTGQVYSKFDGIRR